jgi:hypothetical protein
MIEKNLFKCVKNRRRIGENSTFYLWPINRDDTLLFFLDKMGIVSTDSIIPAADTITEKGLYDFQT